MQDLQHAQSIHSIGPWRLAGFDAVDEMQALLLERLIDLEPVGPLELLEYARLQALVAGPHQGEERSQGEPRIASERANRWEQAPQLG